MQRVVVRPPVHQRTVADSEKLTGGSHKRRLPARRARASSQPQLVEQVYPVKQEASLLVGR
jgi:hypothetical protein